MNDDVARDGILPQYNAFRIDNLSPKTRRVLDSVIECWLTESEHGRVILANLTFDQAKGAVYELLDRRAMVVVAYDGSATVTPTQFGLKLTDLGHALGRGQIQ